MFNNNSVYQYDLDYEFSESLMESADSEGAPAPGASTDHSAGLSYSKTNEQVLGVSEGDAIKTDGQYVYHLQGAFIHIYEVNKGSISFMSIIPLDDINGKEMYLSEDTLIVIGERYESQSNVPEFGCGVYGGDSFTVYTIYDIKDKKNPSLRKTFELEGTSAMSRMVDDKLYFVVNNYSYGWSISEEDELLPKFRNTKDAEGNMRAVPATKVQVFPEMTSATGYMIVGGICVSDTSSAVFDTYLSDGNAFYMNKEALYLTQYDWRSNSTKTNIYKFEASDGRFYFSTKGSVPGTVLNQYSMDVHNDVFRIATTQSDSSVNSGNRILLLDSNMNEVGRTPALANGESIKSVRFMGDMAYMVTYRETDPLYAVDLSTPDSPKVLDALKIPGFSQYLHPVNDNLLVGFGRHTEEVTLKTPDGWTSGTRIADKGLKVSLFDISNPNSLAEADVILLSENSHADAFENPRTLMVDPDNQRFGFIVDYYGDALSTSIHMISVDGQRLNIDAKISIPNDSFYDNARLLLIDDVLYAFGKNTVIAYDTDDYKECGRYKK